MTLTVIFKLVTSITKRMSIMDTAKSLTHGVIEVEACHWNRYAFLVCFNSDKSYQVFNTGLAALLVNLPHRSWRLQSYPTQGPLLKLTHSFASSRPPHQNCNGTRLRSRHGRRRE
jgi:hypothetical protein